MPLIFCVSSTMNERHAAAPKNRPPKFANTKGPRNRLWKAKVIWSRFCCGYNLKQQKLYLVFHIYLQFICTCIRKSSQRIFADRIAAFVIPHKAAKFLANFTQNPISLFVSLKANWKIANVIYQTNKGSWNTNIFH